MSQNGPGRWRNGAAGFAIPIVMSLLLSQACATLARSVEQPIPVTSSPARATVILNGISQGATPLMIRLPRYKKDQVIRIESPGYNPAEIRLRRKIWGGTILGNILMGLAPGLVPVLLLSGSSHARIDPSDEKAVLSIYLKSAAVLGGLFLSIDIGSSNGYTLTPENLTVRLTKADGPPRVDTVVLDADDLRNVKWIRVRRD